MTLFNYTPLGYEGWDNDGLFSGILVFTGLVFIPSAFTAVRLHYHAVDHAPSVRRARQLYEATTAVWVVGLLLHFINYTIQATAHDDETPFSSYEGPVYREYSIHLLNVANFFISFAKAGLVVTIGALLLTVNQPLGSTKPSLGVRLFLYALAGTLICLAISALTISEVIFADRASNPKPKKPLEQDFPLAGKASDGSRDDQAFREAIEKYEEARKHPPELELPFAVEAVDAVYNIVFLIASVALLVISNAARAATAKTDPVSNVPRHALVASSLTLICAVFNFVCSMVFWAGGVDMPVWIPAVAVAFGIWPIFIALCTVYWKLCDYREQKAAASTEKTLG